MEALLLEYRTIRMTAVTRTHRSLYHANRALEKILNITRPKSIHFRTRKPLTPESELRLQQIKKELSAYPAPGQLKYHLNLI